MMTPDPAKTGPHGTNSLVVDNSMLRHNHQPNAPKPTTPKTLRVQRSSNVDIRYCSCLNI